MRLRDLQLIRFGHFSDVKLDFAAEDKRFHVIYGPNEAGKSTALRAISALLFGVPERTTDSYLHAARELRVGAELESGAGERLTVVRRKGRKGTLLDTNGAAIDDARLEAYLGGVSREVFEAMFGMDHERLVEGGRDLLAGHGEVGEALFGAAAGLRGLHDLVESLETQAGEIFKPTAQNPLLNRALAQHREARIRVKEATLRPGQWEDVRRARDEARQEFERLGAERAGSQARLEERRTLQQALPDLRQRAALLSRRTEMGPVVRLPDDAPDRRRQAQTALETAERAAGTLADERTRLEGELAHLQVPEMLLALETRASDLGDRRAVYVNAARDRQQLGSKLDAGEAELRELVRELPRPRPIEEIESLRLDAASYARIRQLAREGGGLQASVATLRGTAVAAARRTQQEEAALEALPPGRDASALRSTTDTARRAGDLESRRLGLASERESQEEQARGETLALPLWSGSPEAAIALPLPPNETLDHFERELGRLGEERRALDERARELRSERDELGRKLAELESEGSIPSSAELSEARGKRDGLWSRVRRVWLEGTAEASSPDALAGEYEAEVGQSDSLADRMFAEHTRVAEIATLRGLARRNEENAASVERERAALEQREAERGEAWNAAWAGAEIQPASPREMRAWKLQHGNLLGLMRELAELRKEIDTLDRSIDAHRAACLTAVAELDGPSLAPNTSLAVVLETAERVIQEIDRGREARGRLRDAAQGAAQEKQRFDQELSDTEEDLAGWRRRWSEAIAPLDLSADAQPDEAEAVLDKLDQLFAKLTQVNGYRERIRHIDQDSADFVSTLEELIRDGCPELPALPPAERSAELLARLQQGRDDRTQRDAKRERLSQIDADLQGLGRDREAAEATIAALTERAGVANVNELEEAERHSSEMRELDQRLSEIEDRLLRTGRPIEELVAEGARVQDEDLIREIDQLQAATEDLGIGRDEWNQKLAGLNRDFEEMDGGAAAAEAAREGEEALAQISHLAVEYARKQIAAVVLRREIQRFADENQGPILTRTSELFQHMTLGRYEGISSGLSDDDESVIFCNRANGEPVGVEGLSDGSRDQLYLSLRLAALEHHMERSEPMPLIVDDVLVTFDDPRSAATLKLMGELSAESQILFFTHHQRLVELAREVIPEDRLAIHELERA